MEIFKRLLRLAKPYYVRFTLAMICMIIAGALQSSLAVLVKPVLDDIFLNKNPATLKWIPLAVIVIFLLKGICNYGQAILMSFIGLRIVTNMRNKLYEQIQKQSLSFFTNNPTGILMSRITNDVVSIQSASSEAVTSLIKDTVTLVSLICVIFYTDWKLAIIAVIVFPLTIYPIARLGKKMRTVATSTQPVYDLINNYVDFTPLTSSKFFKLPDGTVPSANSSYTVTVRYNTVNSTALSIAPFLSSGPSTATTGTPSANIFAVARTG